MKVEQVYPAVEQFAELTIDDGVVVTRVTTYGVKRVDSDYFSAEYLRIHCPC